MENSIEFGELNKQEKAPTKAMIKTVSGCIVLGILFDLLFYNKFLGVSCPIFVILFYGFFIWNFKDGLSFKLSFEWLLSIPIILLSLTYLIFSNEMFRFFNLMAVPILLSVQTILLLKRNKYNWYVIRFIKDILTFVVEKTLGNIPKPIKVIAGVVKNKLDSKKYGVVNKVLVGLIIAIPIVLVVIALLSSADQVFSYYVGNMFQIFKNINLGDVISQLILISVVGIVLSSYMIGLYENKKIEETEAVKEHNKTFDPVILSTILVLINAVYILFTIVQCSYLFGSIHLALPPNFTYADYARRGFFELNVVTLINLGIVLFGISLTKKGGVIVGRIIQTLQTVLIACTFVMLVSAFFRMAMYEVVYGYTYLRILTHAFIVFIFFLLAIALFKIWNNKISLLKPYIITAVAAYVIVNYLNIDSIIVQKNIERYHKIGEIDANYLTSLSYDATPFLMPITKENNKKVSEEIMNGLKVQKEMLKEKYSWQSFNISEFKAKKVLQELSK